MSLRRREHPAARAELRAAAIWYEDQNPALGSDLFDAVDHTLRRIQDHPHSARPVPGWRSIPVVRSMPVPVFPYRVLYYLADDTLVILAYAHHRRSPGYWRPRMLPD